MAEKFQTISPVDGSILCERVFAAEGTIERALKTAAEAQRSWQQTPLEERSAICRRAVEYFLRHADVIGKELTWQMGRPIQYSPKEITGGFRERALHMIDLAPTALAEVEPAARRDFTRFIRRVPIGVAFVLSPWNYPYLTSVNVVIPALLAGNAVLLKHAQQTPLCAERYQAAFVDAGLPEGVFQHLHLSHDQVARVIKDQRVSFVSFTGSVAGGKAVQRAIGERFVGAGLELGGKDPAYVRADADLQYTVMQLVDGAFFNAGQSCCGIERIYVDRRIYRNFVEAFVALTQQYTLGDPLDPSVTLGPMVRVSAARHAARQIEQAVADGARTHIDHATFPAHAPDTPYMAPQVLTEVNHQMDVMREETFGPVVGIMPVDDDQHAVQLMNDSRYGLTASVWTQDLAAAIRIGDQVNTGTWYMNRCDYLDPALAWTGVKDSGRGCTLSPLGFDALTRPKSYHLRTFT